jgi:hypothetical protein
MNAPTPCAVYIWTDGRAFYIGQTFYPRERRGQHRSAARKGGRSAFHTYLRTHGVECGTWHTQWVESKAAAERLEYELVQTADQQGLTLLNVVGGPAVVAPAGEPDYRPDLLAVRADTSYLDLHVSRILP